MSLGTMSQTLSPVINQDYEHVCALLKEAGKVAVSMRDNVEITTKSSPEDLVTCADKALSEMLIDGLTKRFPHDLVLSEEAPWTEGRPGVRRWFIDPIDGTKHYVKNTGRYSVMVGLEENGKLVFGAFYLPFFDVAYFGGPGMGAYKVTGNKVENLKPFAPLKVGQKVRALISKNDLSANLWAKDIPGIEIIEASSIGLDIHEVLSGEADVFVHIRPTLKVWDTAGPAAVALGLGLEAGTELTDHIPFALETPKHEPCIVVGRPGALAWWREAFAKKAQQ